jgi:4-amino-4-deoxy-L-arabinose transferase-like glycosyltransferase
VVSDVVKITTVRQLAPPRTPAIADERANIAIALAVILALSLVVRLGLLWCWWSTPPEIVDAQDYHQLAVRLAETGSYADAQGNLISLRPPLYPAMMAGVYSLAGSENYGAVRALQLCLSMLTTVIVFSLGRAVYSPRVGLIAAAMHAFYPSLLAFSNLLLTEVLFTFLVSLGVWLSVTLLNKPTLLGAVALGLTLALGALTRSTLWIFTPLLLCYLAYACSASIPRRLLVAAVAAMIFALAIAPWAYRNTTLHRTFVPIDVMGGRNVMMGNYEHTPLERSWATIDIVQGDNAWHRVLARHTPNYGELTQGQVDKAAMKYGLNYMIAHPGQSLQRSLVKFFNFWQLERTIVAGMRQGLWGEFSPSVWGPLAIVICGSYAAALFLAIFGIVLNPPTDRRLHWLLLLWIAVPCALHTIAFGHERYHLPLMPILFIYAAAVLGQPSWRRQLGVRWKLSLAGLLCFIFVLAWTRELVVVDLKWIS